MRRDAASDVAERLAARLVAHVAAQKVVDLDALRRDSAVALQRDTSVEVAWIDPASLPPGCSITATYQASRVPARILVARDASPGRRHFSVLHEYGHHLRDQVLEVLEALFDEADGGPHLEERFCDEFAAQILLPRSTIESAFVDGVSARGVLDLIDESSASAQACAVAAARHLTAPGYVLLFGHNGEILFAARSGDALPVARGTRQSGPLAGASGFSLRGRARVTYATGNEGPEMFVDSAVGGGRRVAVLVTDSPPWGDLTLNGTTFEPAAATVCEYCGKEFVSHAPMCRTCGERTCPDCRRCACEPGPARNERRCDICFMTLPAAAFGAGTACDNCT